VRVPLAWLRDYIDLPADAEAIAAKLAMMGFPVEAIERRPALSGVVAGRIATVEKHPNADRLSVCTVDVGHEPLLTIATAATNVAPGQVVPVATIGALLVRDGEPLHIEPRKMRGVDSQGMLCSAEELALPAEWFEDGILQLDESVAPGTDVVAHFRLGEPVLDVEITANRVDAMSVVGIARELGAGYGAAVREPVAFAPVPTLGARDAEAGGVRVTLESPDCRRFVAQRFTNVHSGVAPAWMRIRLALAGQRPLSSIVDVSNFVMLELGQPQHAYDLAALSGARLIVRDARDGETITTLDGEERALDARTLVIADADAAQCIAGLRGAAASEVRASTREIVLESATFAGPRIRRGGINLALRTDASARHERGLTPAMADAGAARAAELLRALGATPHDAFAVGEEPHAAAPIAADSQRIAALAGIALTADEAAGALRGLGFSVTATGTALQVVAPYWRGDVTIAADIAEEVARVVGYDRIQGAPAPSFAQDIRSDDYRHEQAIARACSAGGYREVMSLPLQPRGVYERWIGAGIACAAPPVEILNPLSDDQRCLRFSLLPGLLALAAKHAALAPLRLFEIGHVFEANPQGDPLETPMLAWLAVLPGEEEASWRDSGFLLFKGESAALLRAITGREPEAVTASLSALHPGKTASFIIEGKDVATIGAVDPRLLAAYGAGKRAYAGLARIVDVPAYQMPRYVAPSRFPAVERDVALVLAPAVPAHEIAHAIHATGDGIIAGVRVFDEYRGPQIAADRKSLAVRVRFQRDDATLTDADVDGVLEKILADLRERFGAELRT
jgi:phenylalanyl-tRNA synthetase beta chain